MSLLVGCVAPVAAVAEPTPGKPFEIIPGSFRIIPSTMQAGAYENLTTSFNFAHSEATGKTYNDVKTTVVNLPAGFVGSDTAVPTCTNAELLGRGIFTGSECPIDSQVGTISLELDPSTVKPEPVKVPVYNMEVLTPGIAAEFGFKVLAITQLIPVTVRPGDLGLTATSPSIEQDGEIQNVSFTVWGVPILPRTQRRTR